MNNLYVRLAKNNLKNNKSLYVPYMVAGMITVLMFYIMMFINNSVGLEKMRGAYYITTIMSFGVIVVGVFSYIYIFYTNSFISKRRKKEMGIYNILGMEKRHIAKVLAIETVFTAFVSIVGGIVAGILFSKLALMLIYRILGIQVTIEFSVPPSAVKNTVLVFGILYMMTLFYNLMQMKLANPVELLRGSSVGEKEPKTKWLMAILGVVCLGAGYAIAITTEQPMKVISLFFVAVLLGDRWNIHAVYGGQYCGVKAAAENPWILLPKKAFYRGIDDDVPDEAECGGAGKHLYFIDDGDGHGVYHGLYVCGS